MSALIAVQDLEASQPPPIIPTSTSTSSAVGALTASHRSSFHPPKPEFVDDVGDYDQDFDEFVTGSQGAPRDKGKDRALTAPPSSPPPRAPAPSTLTAEGSISAPPNPISGTLTTTAPSRISTLHAQVRGTLAIEQARTTSLELRVDQMQGDLVQGLSGIVPPSIAGVQSDISALSDASNTHGRNSVFTNSRISAQDARIDLLEARLATTEARATEAMAMVRTLWAIVHAPPPIQLLPIPTSHHEPPVVSAPDSALNVNGKRPRFDEPGNDNATAGPSNSYLGLPAFTPAPPTAFTPAPPTIVQPTLQWQMPQATAPTATAPSHTVMSISSSLPTMLTTPALATMTLPPRPNQKVDVFVGPASWPDGNHDQRDWRTTVSKIVLDVYPGRKIDGQYAVHKSAQHPNYIILKFNTIPDADRFISGWANSPQRLAKYALVGAARHLN